VAINGTIQVAACRVSSRTESARLDRGGDSVGVGFCGTVGLGARGEERRAHFHGGFARNMDRDPSAIGESDDKNGLKRFVVEPGVPTDEGCALKDRSGRHFALLTTESSAF
jgi:hypothetical protein